MKYKILLAEDDKFISRAYKNGLERAGFGPGFRYKKRQRAKSKRLFN